MATLGDIRENPVMVATRNLDWGYPPGRTPSVGKPSTLNLLRDFFAPDIDRAQGESVGCLKRTDPTSMAKVRFRIVTKGRSGVDAVTWPGSSCFYADRLAPHPTEPCRSTMFHQGRATVRGMTWFWPRKPSTDRPILPH